MGSFKIVKKVGTSSYKLDLLAWMRIHNTFHISLLEPYQDNKFPSQIQTSPPPIVIDGEPEYELQEIIDSRLYPNKLQYRAKWTGYSPEHDKSWYTAENFNNASLAIEQFHSRYPRKSRLGTRDHQQVSLRISPRQRRRNPNTAASHRPRRMESQQVLSAQYHPHEPTILRACGDKMSNEGPRRPRYTPR